MLAFSPRRVVAFACLLGLTTSADLLASNVDLFLDWSLLRPNGSVQAPARLYTPTDESGDPLPDRPLVVFLHGLGEAGTDNESQINGNIANLFAAAQARDFYLLAPQSGGGFWGSPARADEASQMIDNALAAFDVDADRIYVTGLSSGGGGAWDFVSSMVDRFAASVPIAGIKPGSSFDPNRLVERPLWVFHARDDDVVGIGNSRRRINDILNAAGEPLPNYPDEEDPDWFFQSEGGWINYTEYKSGGHNSWSRAYNTSEMYDWLLSQSLAAQQGDYNGDGVIDVADYTVWRDSLSQTGIGLAADGNGDQVIDTADYMLWQENYGADLSPPAELVAVPEPAACMTTFVAILAGYIQAFGRRRQ